MTIEDKIITLIEHSTLKDWDMLTSIDMGNSVQYPWMHKTGLILYFGMYPNSRFDPRHAMKLSYSLHQYSQIIDVTYINSSAELEMKEAFSNIYYYNFSAMQTMLNDILDEYIKVNDIE